MSDDTCVVCESLFTDFSDFFSWGHGRTGASDFDGRLDGDQEASACVGGGGGGGDKDGPRAPGFKEQDEW